ncbi:hypothetical protein MNEG_14005 [Monoraphidium neglectum]|uniref:Uncharacterized protein n=1 Tax=Monoraphidium neglectum TaxID=145388 RepID=A0A0D2KDP6_9CHLO|nr:hypothetical protein MNEG_14005 [Monoraphidium neglectum]KIY93958.1 hypothetical protein MNEG_14005 [Monoraphidium neglectum]|eukprot:XP_013892978.1 hypothetical protein MNEG_14005 [Monoraphidium neglectum]
MPSELRVDKMERAIENANATGALAAPSTIDAATQPGAQALPCRPSCLGPVMCNTADTPECDAYQEYCANPKLENTPVCTPPCDLLDDPDSDPRCKQPDA